MKPIRLQHVTSTIRRLPLGTHLVAQAAWFSTSPGRPPSRSILRIKWANERARQEKEHKKYWARESREQRERKKEEIRRKLRGEDSKTLKAYAPKLPSAREPKPPPHPVDFKNLPESQKFKKIFLQLDIGLAALDYRSVQLPDEMNRALFKYLRLQISPRHVMRNWDREYFVEMMNEHPYSVLHRHKYEQMKKNKPLWIWLYGVTQVACPAVVSHARRAMRREIHAALDARGYDPEGRLVKPAKPGRGKDTLLRGDLKGTIALTAKLPADVVKRLPRTELRAAMDMAVDRLIKLKDAEQNPERFKRDYEKLLEQRVKDEMERREQAARREEEWREEQFRQEEERQEMKTQRNEERQQRAEEKRLRQEEKKRKTEEKKRRIEEERPLNSGLLWG
ncbi:hypothetical protein CORC01_01170 [Colletotrichum orchidophilum]|uniref:Uncharacterized protein n=1 Tax=Colletotrichum orchidophilum TaxID=1209926 RepID=A0A1G4BPQ6_9PEZI|nr:uncharacterized protein CORC01_01170 [Colletotrichum orchidophilum]OHF03451.1 hypothetical protein CORC01_01170 [Colletotrichum orchidophilum]